MEPTRIAIIGAGGISKAHRSAIAASGGRATLAAIVEPVAAAREAAIADHAGVRGFDSIDAFFAEPDVADAIILCTPPAVRLSVIERAVAAGLPILVEKPLARTAAEADAIARFARAHADAIASVAYCHRFTPAVAEIKRRIDAGELGEIARFENVFAGPQPRLRTHWMSEQAVSGGGAFLDTGCHSIDLFRHLIGDASMTAAIFRHAWPGRGETGATALLRATSTARHPKCVGTIESGWSEPGRFTLRVVGDRGGLFYDYERPTELLLSRIDGPATTLDVPTHETRFDAQLIGFLDRIAGRPGNVAAATLADGAAVSDLVDEAGKVGQII